jgi:hypothetical protein
MILWSVIFILASFAYGSTALSDPITMHVIPENPKEGSPVVVTYTLNNQGFGTSETQYQFYANGQSVMSGTTILEPASSKQFQYVYENSLEMGEQVTFMVKTQSEAGNHDKTVSIPAYPPQVWSSFVSFATFSTSVISSTSIMGSTSSSMGSTSLISSMGFYEDTFGTDQAMNVGLVFSIVLIILLIYLELTEPRLFEKTYTILGDLRIRFSRVSAVLFVIFIGLVFTQIALIIGGVR